MTKFKKYNPIDNSLDTLVIVALFTLKSGLVILFRFKKTGQEITSNLQHNYRYTRCS